MTTKAKSNKLFCQTRPADESRSRFSDVQLIQLVLQSVQELQWPAGFKHFRGEDGRPVNARMLVSLLAYCYSKGVFDMYEIQSLFTADPAAAYLSANQFPGNSTLRSFRRRHKGLIVECLAILFCKVAGSSRTSECDRSHSDPAGRERETFLSSHGGNRMLSMRESTALVNQAIQTDCMSMDD